MDDLGVVKGLLLRHLRWWASKHDILNVDGTLNLGFLYPNMYICEDYNSPQSVYWCLKSLVVLALSSDHEFWRSKERTLPLNNISLTKIIKPPMHVVCNTGSHHFLLSSGQFCPRALKATPAKYGKFAYSSHFGFSVPTGPFIQQMAPDSTLALSADGGDTWKVHWIPTGARLGRATLVTAGKTEDVPVLVSSWKPWRLWDVVVCTALIAPSRRWPDWHIRVHKIFLGPGNTPPHIEGVEGSFAIYGQKRSDGRPIRPSSSSEWSRMKGSGTPLEAICTDQEGCLVCSVEGASGIRKLDLMASGLQSRMLLCESQGFLMKPDANTNLMHSRTLIPAMKSAVPSGACKEMKTSLLVTGVFAMARQGSNTVEKWNDPPALHLGEDAQRGELGEAYLTFDDW